MRHLRSSLCRSVRTGSTATSAISHVAAVLLVKARTRSSPGKKLGNDLSLRNKTATLWPMCHIAKVAVSVTRDSGPSAVSTNNARRFSKITEKSLCKNCKAKKRKRRTHLDKFRGELFARQPKMCVSRSASNVGRASLLPQRGLT